MTGKRIQAIIGHYGSGKTEIAMNLAIALAQRDPVTLVDLDIVNPYFRSAEHPQVLKAHGEKLVKPEFANTSVDIPSLAADVDAALLDESRRVVLDVGGDDAGARASGPFPPDGQGLCRPARRCEPGRAEKGRPDARGGAGSPGFEARVHDG